MPTRNARGRGLLQVDYDSARTLFEEATALARELGGSFAEGHTLWNGAVCAYMDGDFSVASDLYMRCAKLLERRGSKEGHAGQLFLAGNAAQLDERLADARILLESSIAAFRTFPNNDQIFAPLIQLARIEAVEGHLDRARELSVESLRIMRSVGGPLDITHSIESVAFIEVVAGRGERAARLLGAAEASRERIELPIWPAGQRWYDDTVARAHRARRRSLRRGPDGGARALARRGGVARARGRVVRPFFDGLLPEGEAPECAPNSEDGNLLDSVTKSCRRSSRGLR